jgi:CNT family concentrative nucleoside transporter
LLSPRTVVIATYALCGFANFGSMGIQIGGIAVLAPSQRGNLSRLALLAVAGGTAACLYTAAVAGMFV